MPTYEYECTSCGPFEQFQRITEEALSVCPDCGNPVRRLITSGTGIIFKGSGFYSTDSRSEGSGKPSQNKSDENANKDGSGGDGKPGPVYTKLYDAWCEEVGLDIAGQARAYGKIVDTWKP